METIRLTGRESKLSLLQLGVVKQKIETAFPHISVQIIPRTSRGDALQDIPLQTVEGADFFTAEIFNALASGEADIAVHSLKDMSSEHFFGSNHFAVVDRDDTRDVAIFNEGVIEKLKQQQTIIIGTCSPRREEMATGFLKKALPAISGKVTIQTKFIRGNVDTRLRKLDAGEYDGIILATAGLNRLLKSGEEAPVIRQLLKNKRMMLLPLIECVPAPCQGAIVAEANSANPRAIEILEKINERELRSACIAEKKTAAQYGTGCLQQFGVTTIAYGSNRLLYAAGIDQNNSPFTSWTGLPELVTKGKSIFSTTDFMGSFFHYEFEKTTPGMAKEIVYVSNYKAAEQPGLIEELKSKHVWASGTKTWFELAKKGIWVEGSADAFGLEFLERAWKMPLLNIERGNVLVVTNHQSAKSWQEKGWESMGTYTTSEKADHHVELGVRQADIIFWTSYRQYQQYASIIKSDVIHSCPFGETAEQFKMAGIEPIVFPTIKAFQQWRQISGR